MEPHTPENIVSSSSIVINKNNSKQKRARVILAELEDRKLQAAKDEKATREEALLSESETPKKQLKSAQSMLSNFRKQTVFEEGEKGCVEPDMKLLCRNVEKAVSASLPGRRTMNKAAALMKAIESSMLFNGECEVMLQEVKRLHIRNVFKEWKVLKAYDCSSIGAF